MFNPCAKKGGSVRKTVAATLVAGIWIGFSEFLRNEILFKGLWLDKYADLGLRFPSQTINNALWGVWSFLLAGIIVYLIRKLGFAGVFLVTWMLAFVMMWVVIWNLNVLPNGLLPIAIPWSLAETALAILIARKLLGPAPSRTSLPVE